MAIDIRLGHSARLGLAAQHEIETTGFRWDRGSRPLARSRASATPGIRRCGPPELVLLSSGPPSAGLLLCDACDRPTLATATARITRRERSGAEFARLALSALVASVGTGQAQSGALPDIRRPPKLDQ